MNVYILEQVLVHNDDEFEAKVIVAENEKTARRLANKHVLNEGEIWEDEKLVYCKLVPLSIRNVVMEAVIIN